MHFFYSISLCPTLFLVAFTYMLVSTVTRERQGCVYPEYREWALKTMAVAMCFKTCSPEEKHAKDGCPNTSVPSQAPTWTPALLKPLPHHSCWERHISCTQNPHLGTIFDSSCSHSLVRMGPIPTTAALQFSLQPPSGPDWWNGLLSPRFCPTRLQPSLKRTQEGPSKIKSRWDTLPLLKTCNGSLLHPE